MPTRSRIPKRRPNRGRRIPKSILRQLIEQATVDAHDDAEQLVSFATMLDQRLAVPFQTSVLGTDVTVTRIDQSDDGHIVALCHRGRSRQRIPMLDLPLPDAAPKGAEWIEAYRLWARGR
jgi:hypothetical protein